MTRTKEFRTAWGGLLADLERRRGLARAMGGAGKLTRRKRLGRLNARERIAALVDAESFRELGTLVGGLPRSGADATPADALVAGFARIDSRPVVVGAEDFTVRGGSIGLGTHAKRLRLARLAAQERVPLVMLLEGAGERATNALERYPHAPNDLQALAALSGLVPSVAVVLGPSAGHGALTAPLMDFVVMAHGASLFSAGPPLVAAATGEAVTQEALGGPDVHTRASGVAHNAAADEDEALSLARRYLSFFPSSAWDRPARHPPPLDGRRALDGLLDLIPPDAGRAYDMGEVVRTLVDHDSLLELHPHFAPSILTALARIGGWSVAVLANQPQVMAGTIDRDAADKAARFLEVADAFHLPVVFLADNPGIMAGSAAERAGTLRAAARFYHAQARMRVPKLHVTVRKAYGFGSSLMAMNPFDGQTLTLAFPGATLGAMPAGGGGAAARADTQTQGALDDAEGGGPWSTADTMSYDEVIDPRELRNVLLDALDLASARYVAQAVPRPGGIRP